MKKMLSLSLALSLLLGVLSGCQRADVPPDPPESGASAPVELSCAQILFGVWGALGTPMANGEDYSDEDPEQLSAYIEGAYGLSEGEWEEGCVSRATGAYADELAVLRFADEEAAKHGEERLKEHLRCREGDFTGYAPDQAKMVAEGRVCRQGPYVGLFILVDSARASDLFLQILETGEVPEPAPMPTWMVMTTQDIGELLEMAAESRRLGGIGLERVDGGSGDELRSIVEGEYGLAAGQWEEAAVARGTGGSVLELAVLRIPGEEMARDTIEALNRYLDAREEAFARYPAQAELLHEGLAAWSGELVFLAVCDDPEGCLAMMSIYSGGNGWSSFRRHMEEEPRPSYEPDPDHPDRIKFVPPGKEDMSLYDTAAIRAAWEAGDPAGLSREDRAVYDAAREILDGLIRDGMSDGEKEEAVYRWLVDHVDYDWRHQDVMAETPRTSYQPYGGLVDRAAVCLGYAASFQLLMDLAGVECITVVGAAFGSAEDHAWNMVRLDGAWYCLDVTWDANDREQLGEDHAWRYFNITSDEMAKDHQWDYAGIPEAVTGPAEG